MRKSILSLALVLATYASAGDKQPYHVNVHSGISIFDDVSQLENGSLVGLSATFYERETQSYALQLGYEYLGGIAYEGIVLDTDIDRYYINMIVDGEEELNITPYILLGGGYENVNRVYEEYHDTQSQAFINAGLGFKYRISDYFNITLETRALGKLDSASIDYVGTVGLDFMFGGKWSKKAPMLEALGTPKIIERAKVKSPIKEVKKVKKKNWITPEVVEEMFAEKDQEKVPKATAVKPLTISEDASVVKMQKSLTSLKIQMAQSEALLADKLAKLELALAEKTKQKEHEAWLQMKEVKALSLQKKLEEVALKKEQKRLLALQSEAEAKHLEKMQITQEKIAKTEAAAKALEVKKDLEIEKTKKERLVKLAGEQKKAETLRLKKEVKQNEILKEEKLAKAKRVESAKKEAANKKRLEKIKIAEMKADRERAKRIAKAARVVQKPIEFNDMKEESVIVKEKNLKIKIARKTESVDKLLIRNGMVIFAD